MAKEKQKTPKARLNRVRIHQADPSNFDYFAELIPSLMEAALKKPKEYPEIYDLMISYLEQYLEESLKKSKEEIKQLKIERKQDKEASKEEIRQLKQQRKQDKEASKEEIRQLKQQRKQDKETHKQELDSQEQQLKSRNTILVICSIGLFFALVVSAALLILGGLGTLPFLTPFVMGTLAASILAEVVAMFYIPLKYYHPRAIKKKNGQAPPSASGPPSGDGSGAITQNTIPQEARGQEEQKSEPTPQNSI